jgi:hypothetical protein
LHDRIGAQRGGIDGNRFSPVQSLPFHLIENCLRQASVRDGHSGMDGGRFGEREQSGKFASETIGAAPRDPALAIQAFKMTDKEHSQSLNGHPVY